MVNEWNGLADLLANLITKHISELGLDQVPDPSVSYEDAKTGKLEIEKKDII